MLTKFGRGLALALAAAVAVAGSLSSRASAAGTNFIWTGATNNNWDTTATDLNWTTTGSNSVVWAQANSISPNAATFNTTSTTITVNATIDVGVLNFNTDGWILANGGSFTLVGESAGANGTSLTLAVNVAATDTAYINVPIALTSSGVVMNGPGTVVLDAQNTSTGATTVAGGVLDLNGATGYLGGGVTAGTNLTGKGGTFDYDNTASTGTMSQAMKTLAFTAGDSTVQNTLGGASSSTLTFSSLSARSAGATGNFVVTGGVNGSTNSIVLTGVSNGVSTGFLSQGMFFGGADYAVMNAAGTYVRAAIYGTDAFFNSTDSSGALLASDSNNDNVTTTSITGQTTASVNTIKFSGTGSVGLGLADAQTLTLVSGGLLVSGGTSATISGNNGAHIVTSTSGTEYVFRTDSASDSLAVNVPILANGTNAMTKSGAGTVTLGGANTYTGSTYVNNGVLQAGVVSVSGVSGAFGKDSTIVMANTAGAILDLNNFNTEVGSLTGGGPLGGNVTLEAATLTVNPSGPASFAGTISGAGGGLTKIGTNVQTLTGIDTYSGVTTVSAGQLVFTNEVSLYNDTPASWTAANITVASGAILGLNVGGAGQFTASDVQTISAIGTATTGFLSGSTLGLNASNASPSFTYGNVLANTNGGANILNFDSLGGTMILSQANTYTGTTTVGGGTLRAGVASVANVSGAFGNNSAVIVSSGTLDLNGFNTQIGSLTGSGAVTLEAATLTVGGDNTSPAAYTGQMSGTGGSLVKIGTGTLNLTNTNNTYTGTTSVTNGTLRINGVIASATTVGNAITPGVSAILGGGIGSTNSGTINSNGSNTYLNSSTVGNIKAAVEILGTSGGSGSAGILAPGNSVGTLSVNALTLDSDSVMDYEFSTAPTSNDLTYINGTGALTIGTGGDSIVGINLYQVGGTVPFDTAGTYDLIRYDPTVTIGGDGIGDLTVLDPQAGFAYAFGTTTNGPDNYVTLSITATPEPASLTLLALGAVGLLARRRRR